MKLALLISLITTLLFGHQQLKIASYNVENLFDIKRDGGEYREFIPNTHANWNAKTYKIKLRNIARVIKDIDADIIALEEIESAQALKDLRLQLKKEDLYYNYYKIADKKRTTVKVAILSKKPFVYAKELPVTSSLHYRNILEVKYNIHGKVFYIFVNHWKAKSGPESQRIFSAKVLRKRVAALGYDKNIILLGDFNSDYEEYIKFKRNHHLNDTDSKTGINHILKTLKQRKKAKNTDYQKENFYNLWYDTDPKERYNYIYKRKKNTLDNMLISQSLLEKKEMFYLYDSFHSYKPAYLFHKKRIYKWQISKRGRHKGAGYSDHLPIVATFYLN